MKTSHVVPALTILACAVFFSACTLPGMSATAPADSGAVMETKTVAKEVKTVVAYKTPAGEDKVGFNLKVDGQGVITDASADVLAEAPISITRQEAFAAEFHAAVKGKKLSELTSIDRVGGSSLTTGAFNQALAELKAQL